MSALDYARVQGESRRREKCEEKFIKRKKKWLSSPPPLPPPFPSIRHALKETLLRATCEVSWRSVKSTSSHLMGV